MAVIDEVIAEDTIQVLDHGFVRLDDCMADDLSVVNAARVSFARRKEAMDESDEGLIRFLMRDRHGTPFEHNAFRFHVRTPLFVAREWFRHRVGSFNEFSMRYARATDHFSVPETAQREIRRYAEACELFFAEKMPVTHAAFVAADRIAPKVVKSGRADGGRPRMCFVTTQPSNFFSS